MQVVPPSMPFLLISMDITNASAACQNICVQSNTLQIGFGTYEWVLQCKKLTSKLVTLIPSGANRKEQTVLTQGPNPFQNNTQPILTSLSCSQHWCSYNLPFRGWPWAGYNKMLDFTLHIQSKGGKEWFYRAGLYNGIWAGPQAPKYSPVHLTPLIIISPISF